MIFRKGYMQRFASVSPEAWQQVFQYERMFYKLYGRYFPKRDEETRLDAFHQIGMPAIIRASAAYQGRIPLTLWMHICISRALNDWRRHRGYEGNKCRRKEISELQWQCQAAGDCQPSTQVDISDSLAAVMDKLPLLSDLQRRVILEAVAGTPHKDIAAKINRTRQSVDNLYNAAIARLKVFLEKTSAGR